MEKKSNKIQVINRPFSFEYNEYQFRRLHGHTGEDNALWSLFVMEKSKGNPNLYILVKVKSKEISVKYYYQGEGMPDSVAHAVTVFYNTYLRMIYP